MANTLLRNRVHYLDTTGEIDVFEALAARDAEAKMQGLTLLLSVGFDVVPSDCTAGVKIRERKHVAADEEIKALNEGKKKSSRKPRERASTWMPLQEILRLRKQDNDERDEQKSLLDLYLKAMESAGSSTAQVGTSPGGGSVREATWTCISSAILRRPRKGDKPLLEDCRQPRPGVQLRVHRRRPPPQHGR